MLAKPTTVLSELCTWKVNHIIPDCSYLNLSVAALYLQTLAINKGRETASSQRFSYFGSLAEGNGGDGAWVENRNKAMSFLLPDSLWSPRMWCEQRTPFRTWADRLYSSGDYALWQREFAEGYRAVRLTWCQPSLHPSAVWGSCCVSLQVCPI